MTMRAAPKKERFKAALESEKSCRGAGCTETFCQQSSIRPLHYLSCRKTADFFLRQKKEILRCLQVLSDNGFKLSQSVASKGLKYLINQWLGTN